MSQLANTYRNEETLPYQYLPYHDISNPINQTQESWCLRNFNQYSIFSHHFELDQYQSLNKLASFHFNEIELEYECDSDLQFCDSVSNFKSMLTLTFLPNLECIPEPTLIPNL